MKQGLERFQATGNELILRHPIVSVVGAAVLLIMGVGGVAAAFSPEAGTASSWVTVAVLVLIAYGGAMAIAITRVVRRRADEALAVSWGFAISPAFIAWTSMAIFGTPTWIPGLGVLVSLTALIITTRMAIQARARQD